jgi:hypothetical protein
MGLSVMVMEGVQKIQRSGHMAHLHAMYIRANNGPRAPNSNWSVGSYGNGHI